MTILKVTCSIFLLSILLSSNAQKLNDKYICFEFSYRHVEQPIPVVIFYRDSFITNEIFFSGYRFKIKRQEFDTIENVVKNKSSYLIIDSFAERYYSIVLVKEGKKTVYGTVNLTKTKEIFAEILNKLQSSEKHSEINKAIEQLYTYLKPRGSFD